MTEKQKQDYLSDETKEVKNYFMIQEDDGSFRIQSHYLKSLEKQVNDILKKYPDIGEKLNEITTKEKVIKKEIEEKEKELKKLVGEKIIKIKEIL